MMREVETSDGEVWECFVEWEGRRALHSSARYLRKTREARARRKAEGRSMDIADGCDPFVGIDGFVAIVVLIAVVVLLVAIGPEFIAVLFGVVELGAVLLLAAIGFARELCVSVAGKAGRARRRHRLDRNPDRPLHVASLGFALQGSQAVERGGSVAPKG
ncbi:MAG: hypothetical protein R8J94_11080 [Acidimicrobiia bacterium]|nr:hypothetical protein [Acidimicrobiia bacterium]